MSIEFRFPPRPLSKMNPLRLNLEEKKKIWVAQYKYNGSRAVVVIQPSREITMYERHGKKFVLPDALKQQILSLNLVEGKGYILDGEYLHNKTKSIKETLVVYDVLWCGDEEHGYLYGTTVSHRLHLLDLIFRSPRDYDSNKRGLFYASNLWMAPTFTDHFMDRYNDCRDDDNREGLVLKKPDAVLDKFGTAEYEVPWMIRVRKRSKHSEF